MIAAGRRSKMLAHQRRRASRGSISDVPNVSTMIDTGCATPIAYATCTSQRLASPAATTFLATWRTAYAAERSTLVGSLPQNAPPPWRAMPP